MTQIDKTINKYIIPKNIDGEKYMVLTTNILTLKNTLKKEQINFYEYMDDHYTRVSDGFVTKIELGVSHPIISIEQALEEYNRGDI